MPLRRFRLQLLKRSRGKGSPCPECRTLPEPIARSAAPRRLLLSGALLLLCLFPTGVAGQGLLVSQVVQFFAPDGELNDRFGTSAALFDTKAVIGTGSDDTSVGSNAGSAWIFELGLQGSWTPVEQLFASDAQANDRFGDAVSIFEERALIGASLDNTASGGLDAGSAYIFERSNLGQGFWFEAAQLFALDASQNDNFGSAVSLSGDRALIGAPGNSTPSGGLDAGSAYIFEPESQGDWIEVAQLFASDAAEADQFGSEVVLEGSRALVAAPFDDVGGMQDAGSVYIFERDAAGNWIERAQLTAPTSETNARFGSSLALRGDRALIGAEVADSPGAIDSGSATIFERDGGGVWNAVATLFPDLPNDGDRFGSAVALFGDLAWVAAERDDDPSIGTESGSVFIFERSSTGSWNQVLQLNSGDTGAGDRFGSSLSVSGPLVLIGSSENDTADGNSAGSAEIFEVSVTPAAEDCTDGIDNDGDQQIDCADPDCNGAPPCLESGNCTDGIDNDGDQQIDCADPDCAADPACTPEDCTDGIDNDGDQQIDCADPDCNGAPPCLESGNCTDGIDNDGDQQIDCADPDCAADPACTPEDCSDGVDNDGDQQIDCADDDCRFDPLCQVEFIRGDVNGNGSVALQDLIILLNYLFAGQSLGCIEAANLDDNQNVALLDVIYGLTYLFQGGPPPQAPFPNCGGEPQSTFNTLGCLSYPACP